MYKGAINSLDANGNTAMYNGLCVAMDRIYKKSQELGGNCTPIIFVLTNGDNNTGYKFSETKDIIAGMNIPIYTISYNYAADSLSELASINEAASIVGNSEDITYKLRNLFNAEMWFQSAVLSAQLLKKRQPPRGEQRATGNTPGESSFRTEGRISLCEYNRFRTLPISSITTITVIAVYPKAEKARNLSRNLRCKHSSAQ